MTYLLLLTSLLLLSLLVVYLVNQREERFRRIRLQQRRFRGRVDALEEVLVGIEETLPNRAIARCINREILHLLEQMLDLEPDDKTHLETRISHVKEREDEMLHNRERRQASRLRESDAEMARAQECLDQAARVLRRQNGEGRLEGNSLEDYLSELAWTKLTINVVTYISEGHKALQRGDITTAHAYYKRAQGLLIGSDDPNPQRMAMIRELGDVIQGKRTALSPELMPEDDYNP